MIWSHEKPDAVLAPPARSDAASAGSSRTRPIAELISATSPIGTTSALSPSRAYSSTPTFAVVTTGAPQAMASSGGSGKDS
jgi:hypothetical protein